jgi:hypothetical protein
MFIESSSYCTFRGTACHLTPDCHGTQSSSYCTFRGAARHLTPGCHGTQSSSYCTFRVTARLLTPGCHGTQCPSVYRQFPGYVIYDLRKLGLNLKIRINY